MGSNHDRAERRRDYTRVGITAPGRSGASGPRRWWRRHKLQISTSAAVVLVLLLGGLQVLESFTRVELPEIVRQPLVPILLTLLVLFFSFQSYRESLAARAFYRRFVRPGLRHLLELDEGTLSRGDKLFRPHRAVLMKIDVEGYTFLTYDMPYGMRRLFLDLWYTMVDDVLARDIFFDKSLGDGSLYLFDAEKRADACGAALRAALTVRDETVPAFDRTFLRELSTRLAEEPQLRVAAELYLERYRERAGRDFRERRTVVRVALAAGCVDEGLWGLPSQSHYDVQGTPLVLVARLEQAAASGEILLDKSFADALLLERGESGLPAELEPRVLDIRGIGERDVWVVPPTVRNAPAPHVPDPEDSVWRHLPGGRPERAQKLEAEAPGAAGL